MPNFTHPARARSGTFAMAPGDVPARAAGGNELYSAVVLSTQVAYAHKDPWFAKYLRLSDRELALLINHAYNPNKQPGDLTPEHFPMFEEMFTSEGLVRIDRKPFGAPATTQLGSKSKIHYIAFGRYILLAGDTVDSRSVCKHKVQPTIANLKHKPGLYITDDPVPPEDASVIPLSGMHIQAFPEAYVALDGAVKFHAPYGLVNSEQLSFEKG